VNGRILRERRGVGIDGHVAERIEASAASSARGSATSSERSCRSRLPARQMRVRIDGETVRASTSWSSPRTGTYFEAAMPSRLGEAPDDGLFDIVVAGISDGGHRWSRSRSSIAART